MESDNELREIILTLTNRAENYLKSEPYLGCVYLAKALEIYNKKFNLPEQTPRKIPQIEKTILKYYNRFRD